VVEKVLVCAVQQSQHGVPRSGWLSSAWQVPKKSQELVETNLLPTKREGATQRRLYIRS
jgi:hypothetical protein